MTREFFHQVDLEHGNEARFRFIDLFAGIGGFRIAAEASGGKCVFSSEKDKAAALTYERNFGDKPHGDITAIDPNSIPDHDLLLGGFPCQPFSICSRHLGFQDTRGTLFFYIAEIARVKRPQCIVLENVKHFSNHDGGQTLTVVKNALIELGYTVVTRVLNANNFGLAQNRERTIIVASLAGEFDFSSLVLSRGPRVKDILEQNVEFSYLPEGDYTLLPADKLKLQSGSGLQFVGYRNRELRKAGTRPGTEHLSRVHKQPNRIYDAGGTHPTLAAGESSGRYWILLDERVRKLTMRECYRLQGFPETYAFHQSAAAAYKQIGNSVPVPMIAEVIRSAIAQSLVSTPLTPALAA
jgi:DNA (cytosine-5)-methyltransferase 1